MSITPRTITAQDCTGTDSAVIGVFGEDPRSSAEVVADMLLRQFESTEQWDYNPQLFGIHQIDLDDADRAKLGLDASVDRLLSVTPIDALPDELKGSASTSSAYHLMSGLDLTSFGGVALVIEAWGWKPGQSRDDAVEQRHVMVAMGTDIAEGIHQRNTVVTSQSVGQIRMAGPLTMMLSIVANGPLAPTLPLQGLIDWTKDAVPMPVPSGLFVDHTPITDPATDENTWWEYGEVTLEQHIGEYPTTPMPERLSDIITSMQQGGWDIIVDEPFCRWAAGDDPDDWGMVLQRLGDDFPSIGKHQHVLQHLLRRHMIDDPTHPQAVTAVNAIKELGRVLTDDYDDVQARHKFEELWENMTGDGDDTGEGMLAVMLGWRVGEMRDIFAIIEMHGSADVWLRTVCEKEGRPAQMQRQAAEQALAEYWQSTNIANVDVDDYPLAVARADQLLRAYLDV